MTYKGDRFVLLNSEDILDSQSKQKLLLYEKNDRIIKNLFNEMPSDNKTGYIIKSACVIFLFLVAMGSFLLAIIFTLFSETLAVFSAGIHSFSIATLLLFGSKGEEVINESNSSFFGNNIPYAVPFWMIGLFLMINYGIEYWGSESSKIWLDKIMDSIILGILIFGGVAMLVYLFLRIKHRK